MQKKLLKNLTTLLSISLLATAFVGCSNSTTPSSSEQSPSTEATSETSTQTSTESEKPADGPKEFANKELNVALFQGGYGAEYWEEIIAMFEAAYPGVKVNATINPKIGEIIRPQIVAGNSPDFIYLNDTEPSGVTLSLIKENQLLDLTDVFDSKALDHDEKLRDMVLPGMLESTKYSPYGDRKIYLAPFNSGPMGLIYNKTLFDNNGWELPETWDEFFALGDVAKEKGYSLFTYQGIHPGYLESLLYPAIANAGGVETIDKIGNYEEGSFKNDSVKKVLEQIQKIGTDGYLMEGTIALNHTQSQADMMLDKALFITNGTWMEGEMKDSPRSEGFKFGMMPAPVFNKGDEKYVMTSYEQFCIPTAGKNPELAKEFLKFLYTDASVELFAQKSGGVYSLKGAKELAKPYISEDTYSMYDVLDNTNSMLVNFKALPKGSKINVSQEVFANCATPIMTGEMTPDQWIDNVEKAFAQIRSEY